MSVSTEWWQRSRAYLKVSVDDDDGKVVPLSHADSTVVRDLGSGLLVCYIVDEGERFGYVQNRHLAESQATEDDLHRSGVANLYDLAEENLRVQPHGPVYALLMEGNFEASVLLLDTVWSHSLAGYVSEDFVVAIPARDVLAFGDSSSSESVQELHAIVQRVYHPESDHLLSPHLYRRKADGNWVVHRS